MDDKSPFSHNKTIFVRKHVAPRQLRESAFKHTHKLLYRSRKHSILYVHQYRCTHTMQMLAAEGPIQIFPGQTGPCQRSIKTALAEVYALQASSKAPWHSKPEKSRHCTRSSMSRPNTEAHAICHLQGPRHNFWLIFTLNLNSYVLASMTHWSAKHAMQLHMCMSMCRTNRQQIIHSSSSDSR